MTAVTMQEAQANLPEIIDGLQPGEEVLIIDQGRPLAAVKKAEQTTLACEPGCYRKAEFWMAPDFDAPLDEFREYME